MSQLSQHPLEVQRFKISIAQKLAKKYLSREIKTRPWNLEKSIFSAIISREPFQNTREVVEFTLSVASEAVKAVLKLPDASITTKLELVSTIVETSAREFIDPHPPHRINFNLSTAKQAGYFFTPYSVAAYMSKLGGAGKHLHKGTVIDPSCGCGMLLAAVLMKQPDITALTGVESDAWTSGIALRVLRWLASQVGSSAEIKIINTDGLEYLQRLASYGDERKYDLLIMNPPYGRVRHLYSSLTDLQTKTGLNEEKRKKLHERIRQETIAKAKEFRQRFSNVGSGKYTPELSKLFLSLSLSAVKRKARVVAITPASWLTDKSSTDLRRLLLEQCSVKTIVTFRETAKFFSTVNQPTAIVSLQTRGKTGNFLLLPDLKELRIPTPESVKIHTSDLRSSDPQYLRIPRFGNARQTILAKIQSGTKLQEISGLLNLRGEVDLTLHRAFITNNSDHIRLVRGDHVRKFKLRDPDESRRAGFVDSERLKSSLGKVPKLLHADRWRMACAQCSYAEKSERLAFCLVPPKHILGNSCNYIMLDSARDHSGPPAELLLYLAFLNSVVTEWEFRCFNANNHVANYEIDQLHVPKELRDYKSQILPIVQELVNGECSEARFLHSQLILQAIIARAYALTKDEFSQILTDLNHPNRDEILKYFSFHLTRSNGDIADSDGHGSSGPANHVMSSLSLLDKIIIDCIPQGGNWQDVPEYIPSKRLDQIREMTKKRGLVRTSYYGRLRPDQPAYTIATYFNRPGNGTNIHFWEDRTLSSREAARLQSFPDSFAFQGSERSIREQIGNAVPPLLAYALGEQLRPKTCVDLFAGAGGLSLGLKMAGSRIIAAQDIDLNAAKTFRHNHSQDIAFIEGDINDDAVRNDLIAAITEELHGEELDLLAGGPPCQGFSTAGWRSGGDERNQLVNKFLQIAEALTPKMILIENVEGLLSHSKGSIVQRIHARLSNLGYKTFPQPWLLKAEQYGVPQMRKRIFIVAVRQPLALPRFPPAVFAPCRGRLELRDKFRDDDALVMLPPPITAEEAIGDLPRLTARAEGIANAVRPHYREWATGNIGIEQFLAIFRSQQQYCGLPLLFEQESPSLINLAQAENLQ